MRRMWAFGIIGVSVLLAAEPVCRRIVIPVVRRHFSPATIARWDQWNATHVPPTPKQTLHELDLACPPVETADAAVDGFILPVNAPVWDQPAVVQDALLAVAPTPSIAVPVIGGAFYAGGVPLPVAYAGTSPVPEPATIWLLLAGVIGVGWLKAFPSYSQAPK